MAAMNWSVQQENNNNNNNIKMGGQTDIGKKNNAFCKKKFFSYFK